MSEADAQAGGSQGKSKRAGMLPTALAVGLLTVIAGGGGAGMGMLLAAAPAPAATEPADAASAKPEPAVASDTSPFPAEEGEEAAAAGEAGEAPLVLVPLRPVLTNLYSPANTWLRLEASLVIRDDGSVDPEILAARIEADTLAFLRSVQLAQLEGTRGLLHLREDLVERARLRSPAVIDYLIQAMVAE